MIQAAADLDPSRVMGYTVPMHMERPRPDNSLGDIYRVTALGLAANLFLAGVKFTAGLLAGSRAVSADAVHSLSDSATDLIILAFARVWSAPADRAHPYGHQRVETLVAGGIGLSLALVGLGLGYDAATFLLDPPEAPAPPGLAAALAALASILVKELLYRWTRRVGEAFGSRALVANAWHHRSDALSSIPAFAAAAGARLFPELWWLDPLGALVVCGFLLHAAWGIVRPALDELTDRAAPKDDVEELKALAHGVPGALDIHRLRTRSMGGKLVVDLHVCVDPSMTVREGHAIAHAVSAKLRMDDRVMEVITHLEPAQNENCAPHGHDLVDGKTP